MSTGPSLAVITGGPEGGSRHSLAPSLKQGFLSAPVMPIAVRQESASYYLELWRDTGIDLSVALQQTVTV